MGTQVIAHALSVSGLNTLFHAQACFNCVSASLRKKLLRRYPDPKMPKYIRDEELASDGHFTANKEKRVDGLINSKSGMRQA